MQLFDYLAEQEIVAAMQRGEFANLPGAGKALNLEDDSMIPEELRMAYRILKNSGFIPPQVEVRGEISALMAQITAGNDRDNEKVLRKLRYLYMYLAEHGSAPFNLAVQDAYFEKLKSQLAGSCC